MSDRTEFREGRSRSWFDSEGSKLQAARLCERLRLRCAGERGLFLTLTYRHDGWESPEALFDATSRDRHVRRFMANLGLVFGDDFTGRWLCKLEFQSGGWAHFHIILLGVDRIPHDVLMECWGFGFVWVKRLTPDRIAYTAKYIAKDGGFPPFILLRPQRSIRVVRVSPGFWGGGQSARSDPRDWGATRVWGCYVSIGQAIENGQSRTLARCCETGRYVLIRASISDVMFGLLCCRRRFTTGCRGWVSVRCSIDDIVNQMAVAARRAQPARRSALHLKKVPEPPKWVVRYLQGAALAA